MQAYLFGRTICRIYAVCAGEWGFQKAIFYVTITLLEMRLHGMERERRDGLHGLRQRHDG